MPLAMLCVEQNLPNEGVGKSKTFTLVLRIPFCACVGVTRFPSPTHTTDTMPHKAS